MVGFLGAPKLGIAGAIAWLLLWPITAWSTDSGLVQRIGLLSGPFAEAVAEQVTIVPFSPRLDASKTPIVLEPGIAFLDAKGRIRGPRPVQRRAIRRAYDAGRTIVILNASVHDVEALHVLLEDGVAYESTTDPVALAYALRRENNLPTARVLSAPADEDPEAGERALQRALDVVISELTHVPVVGSIPTTTPVDWGASPVQSTTLTSTSNGIYNTPMQVYALHSCEADSGTGIFYDYYLVDTGGDWTATGPKYESASQDQNQISLNSNNGLDIDWQDNDDHCTGGSNVSFLGGDRLICRFINYPTYYRVDIVPPSAPTTVIQIKAQPEGDQGKSTSYSSGFEFSLGGDVNISGDGPSAGIQAGATWDNTVSTTVPALVIDAGDEGNQGTFTEYRYCTVGTAVEDCTSTIQMTNPVGEICHDYIVGKPQKGQTPNGRLSEVAQTVTWQVDPATYVGSTFDITVTWTVDLATSTSRLWHGGFKVGGNDYGPTGYCNGSGCTCTIGSTSEITAIEYVFKVPFPPKQCPS